MYFDITMELLAEPRTSQMTSTKCSYCSWVNKFRLMIPLLGHFAINYVTSACCETLRKSFIRKCMLCVDTPLYITRRTGGVCDSLFLCCWPTSVTTISGHRTKHCPTFLGGTRSLSKTRATYRVNPHPAPDPAGMRWIQTISFEKPFSHHTCYLFFLHFLHCNLTLQINIKAKAVP